MLVFMLSCFRHVRLFETLWTVAHQAPLSTGFSRQEYWSRLPCPPPGDLPEPGIKPLSFLSPALVGRFFTTSATHYSITFLYKRNNIKNVFPKLTNYFVSISPIYIRETCYRLSFFQPASQ